MRNKQQRQEKLNAHTHTHRRNHKPNMKLMQK